MNVIIGSGGKKVKSIIEETGVEAIDAQDDGIVRLISLLKCAFILPAKNSLFMLQVKITANNLESLEKSKAIIANLTMVPVVGDIYRSYLIP